PGHRAEGVPGTGRRRRSLQAAGSRHVRRRRRPRQARRRIPVPLLRRRAQTARPRSPPSRDLPVRHHRLPQNPGRHPEMSFSVSLRDVTLQYGDTDALSDVTLTLEGGKIHGLLGRNGAGKTSLLSLLAAFRKPTGGEVLVDGRPVWENIDVVSQIALI